jgi:serine-type D-Ala-D-Ala endopeptidase (penicillin-binding protein 7)
MGSVTGLFRRTSIVLLSAAFVSGMTLASASATAATSEIAAAPVKADNAPVAKPRAAVKRTKTASKHKARKTSRKTKRRHGRHARVYAPAIPSVGHTMGLQAERDLLSLKSSVALVLDQESNEILFEKNPHAVLPIASLTKLMTAIVVIDAKQPMDELLEISVEDSNYEKRVSSRLRPGTKLTREDMLVLALMASENRAASALGRHFPGGLPAFMDAMNAKARALGMNDTRYVDPAGLSQHNVSSAIDLAKLVDVAYDNPTIRDFSTLSEHTVQVGRRKLQFHSTNALVRRPKDWQIGLQKTGFTNEAGRCLVMQAAVQGRNVVMVFLDSAGKLTRFADANRVRHWIESASFAQRVPAPVLTPVRETTVAPEQKM